MNRALKIYKSIFNITIFCIIALFLNGCNTTKRTTIKDLKGEKSVDYLAEKLTQNSFNFNWFSGKMEIKYDNKGKEQSFKATFRIKKDSVIWMSIYPALGIEVARVFVTPDSVKLINKLNKQYFIGDFSYLSKLLKTELNFELLQSLLVGNEYWIAEKKKLFSSIDFEKNAYLISTVKKRKLRKIEEKDKEKVNVAQGIWVAPQTFRVLSLLINDIKNRRRLKIDYNSFKEIGEQKLATKLNANIESLEGKYNLSIKLSKLKINKPYKLSFKIPEKYAKIH